MPIHSICLDPPPGKLIRYCHGCGSSAQEIPLDQLILGEGNDKRQFPDVMILPDCPSCGASECLVRVHDVVPAHEEKSPFRMQRQAVNALAEYLKAQGRSHPKVKHLHDAETAPPPDILTLPQAGEFKVIYRTKVGEVRNMPGRTAEEDEAKQAEQRTKLADAERKAVEEKAKADEAREAELVALAQAAAEAQALSDRQIEEHIQADIKRRAEVKAATNGSEAAPGAAAGSATATADGPSPPVETSPSASDGSAQPPPDPEAHLPSGDPNPSRSPSGKGK